MKRQAERKERRELLKQFRVTEEEAAALASDAARAGVDFSTYCRLILLNAPLPRHKRVDMQAVGKLIGEINRLGGNVNQIAKAANINGQPEPESLDDIRGQLADIRNAAMRVLGFEA